MTEQTEEIQDGAQEAVEKAPPPQPPEPEEAVPKRGFLSRMNPLKMFRKESPAMYIKEGHSLIENHNLALATMAFQKAIELDPKSLEAHKGLGNVYMRKGGRTGINAALECFKTATVIAPFEDTSYALTARLYEKLHMMKEATIERKKMMIVKTLQTDPKNPIANNNMGILLLGQKQVTQAIEYFQKSVEANPAYDIAYRNLSATYFRIASESADPAIKGNNLGKARTFIGKALAISKTASSTMVLGKILVAEERLDEALELAEEAEAMDPHNKDVFAFKRIVLEKLNRTKDAQEAYESYKEIADQTPTG